MLLVIIGGIVAASAVMVGYKLGCWLSEPVAVAVPAANCKDQPGPHEWGAWKHEDIKARFEEEYSHGYGGRKIVTYECVVAQSRRYCERCNDLQEKYSRQNFKRAE